MPMVFVLTGGERYEQPVLPVLMERGAVKRRGREWPRVRPDRVAGDKGHTSSAVRRYLKGRRIGAGIPTKADEAPDPTFDRAAYRGRNAVERLINRLKRYRRVAARSEKRAATCRAMLTVAGVRLWLWPRSRCSAAQPGKQRGPALGRGERGPDGIAREGQQFGRREAQGGRDGVLAADGRAGVDGQVGAERDRDAVLDEPLDRVRLVGGDRAEDDVAGQGAIDGCATTGQLVE